MILVKEFAANSGALVCGRFTNVGLRSGAREMENDGKVLTHQCFKFHSFAASGKLFVLVRFIKYCLPFFRGLCAEGIFHTYSNHHLLHSLVLTST